MLVSEKLPKPCVIWSAGNELKPAELFCYLGARFGAPNGFQNFLRNDSSDNLIHWEWTLTCEYGVISFQGMNFRTEILLHGPFPFNEADKAAFVAQINKDFTNHRKPMADIRRQLEQWVEFANPYHRLRRSIDLLMKELQALELDPQRQAIPDFHLHANPEDYKDKWDALGERYSKGLGICFGIRSMIPVMAEAFVNLLLFALMRKELKEDKRLRENAFRQHIDIRIKSLHMNCHGFKSPVDYGHATCKAYHAIVNERNDLLHGNVSIEKLRFNELYFLGRIPIFHEYRSMWDRTLGVDVKSVGLDKVANEERTVREFIDYVLSCLESEVAVQMKTLMKTRDLGEHQETGRLGILFSGALVDWKMGPPSEGEQKSPINISPSPPAS